MESTYVNQRQLIELLVLDMGLSKADCQRVLKIIVKRIVESAAGGRVKVPGLGTFTSLVREINYYDMNKHAFITTVKPRLKFKPEPRFLHRIIEHQHTEGL